MIIQHSFSYTNLNSRGVNDYSFAEGTVSLVLGTSAIMGAGWGIMGAVGGGAWTGGEVAMAASRAMMNVDGGCLGAVAAEDAGMVRVI